MKTAFEDLERTITPEDARKFFRMTLKQVQEEIFKTQEQLVGREYIRHFGRLNPLFKRLENFAKAAEILFNGTPFLSWLWGPITLILKVSSDYVYAYEQIIIAYSRIGEALKRFEILGDALSMDGNFQWVSAALYAGILQFHKHAYTSVRRSGKCSNFFSPYVVTEADTFQAGKRFSPHPGFTFRGVLTPFSMI